jgi:carotenoid cleavage dioxygenase-like enzyme
LTPQYQSHFYIVNFWSTAMSANEQLASGPASPPDGPVLEAIFGGLQREHDFVPLRVDGRLPADLRGTLFRNGPAVFTAGRNPHWFDGTGAITAVRVDGVEAFGAVRVVHTPSADHDAGRADNRYSGFLQKMSWGSACARSRGDRPRATPHRSMCCRGSSGCSR